MGFELSPNYWPDGALSPSIWIRHLGNRRPVEHQPLAFCCSKAGNRNECGFLRRKWQDLELSLAVGESLWEGGDQTSQFGRLDDLPAALPLRLRASTRPRGSVIRPFSAPPVDESALSHRSSLQLPRIANRRRAPGGARAATLQAEPARPGRDVPGSRLRIHP